MNSRPYVEGSTKGHLLVVGRPGEEPAQSLFSRSLLGSAGGSPGVLGYRAAPSGGELSRQVVNRNGRLPWVPRSNWRRGHPPSVPACVS